MLGDRCTYFHEDSLVLYLFEYNLLNSEYESQNFLVMGKIYFYRNQNFSQIAGDERQVK